MKRFLTICIAALTVFSSAFALNHTIKTEDTSMEIENGALKLSTKIILDSLKMKSNQQLYVIPIIEGPDGGSEIMPAILINGRNMHYLYERGTVKKPADKAYNVVHEAKRINNTKQTINYTATAPFRKWMLSPKANLRFELDTCGCGRLQGAGVYDAIPLDMNPVGKMHLAYVTPAVTALPVSIHEGRARVQFEVDRTELHDSPYVCRNGQRIDNRSQLQIIDDSISYALSDPNVEIASIKITGYASPESPYLHNEELSTGRSRALAEYLAAKYHLPADRSNYSSVPENWKEFRDLVVKSPDITETQRHDLLALIDRPAYGPSDYDAKERELKTDKKFASLYRSLILPKWFPLLRATEFAISTRLKPLSDQQLADVIHKSPEKMSLNQMMRVARLYEEGSPQFNEAINIALKFYPLDEAANLNAAITAYNDGDMQKAESLVIKAGDSPEANNLRGVIATGKGDFEAAQKYFEKAKSLPEARSNVLLIKDVI